jgi:APA family basic amino acid/polyamine antiporter
VAAVSVAFAKYLGVFLPGLSEDAVLFTVASYRFSTAQAAALVVIVALTAVNIRGLRTGAWVQNVFTVAKVAGVAALVLLALASGKGSAANFSGPAGLPLGPEGVKLGLFAALAVAMSKALFAYDAWQSITFAAEEVKDPERILPRALITGTLGVTVVYCAAVAIYLYMVPIGEMFAVQDNRIAAEAASRALGPAGAAFIAIAILISTFGCVNGLTLAGPRVVYAMARDGLFFRSMAEIHARFRTPARALVLHGLVAAALTLTGTYSDLLTLTAFSSLLFNVLTVIGLFVLRRTEPALPRPYRALGYPVLPALYVLVSSFFLVYILVGDPRNSGMGLVLTVVGIPAYLYWRRQGRRK